MPSMAAMDPCKVPDGWPLGSFQEWRSLIFEPSAEQARLEATMLGLNQDYHGR